MSDKVRGALFNTLGDLDGLTVLDAFAGSGALAFEAISRAARTVVAIDSDRNAQMAIDANIKDLGLADQVHAVKTNVGAWLATTSDTFDIVICDPPYDRLQPRLLAKLAERVGAGGLVVYSLPPGASVSLPVDTYVLLARKNYGDAELWFYRAIS